MAVNVQTYPGQKGAEDRKNEINKLIGKYAIPTTTGGSRAVTASPLPYEVTNTPQQSITIDLVKGTITKN